MTSFIPNSNPDADDQIIVNDGFYPDIKLSDMKKVTGLDDVFDDTRVCRCILTAIIEVNASISKWRLLQVDYASLGDVPSTMLGDVHEKSVLYESAVFARARGALLNNTRDYDSTKTGHDKADKLEDSANHYFQQCQEYLSRLTGRGRTMVELI